MELKLGYKQTEVGVIPEDWEVRLLSSTAKRVVRGASPRPIDSPIWFDQQSTIGWVRISDVTRSGRYLHETTQRLSKEGVKHSRYVRSGSLIMSICATVGRPIETQIDTCIHDGFVLFDEPLVDQSFLYHLLIALEPTWSKQGQTGSQMNLNTGIINSCAVPVPPLPEQKAIAQALSDMDTLISGLDSLIAKKRDIKQATMQQLLTGKTRLPGFSGDWEIKRLGELFTFSGGYSASRDQLSSEGHCYLHYGDIHGSNRTFIDVDADFQTIPKLDVSLRRVSPVSLLRDGDVVFVDASEDDAGASKHVVVVSGLGKTFISGLHTIIAKALTDKLDNGYKRYCFQTAAIKKQFLFYAVGTKVTGISKSNIPRLILPIPPLPEQQAIAKVLTDMDAELEALEERREKTRELKQAMMQELLTGRTRLV
jgi:type I restriction enzyme S subunit